MVPSHPLIHLVDVTKGYPLGSNTDVTVWVLNDINLKIHPGEFVAIMGPSGSGKSTMMNILGLLDRHDDGQYYLNGEDVSHMDTDQLADARGKFLGFVFQGFNLLFRRNVLENIALPLVYAGMPQAERLEKAQHYLNKVGLGTYSDYLPTQLSGGQQQRIAIARALVNEPQIILADEPTGNLDSKTSEDIMVMLQELNRNEGITIVLVTHEPDIARYAKRLVQFRDGHILYDGPVEGAKL